MEKLDTSPSCLSVTWKKENKIKPNSQGMRKEEEKKTTTKKNTDQDKNSAITPALISTPQFTPKP